MYAKLAIRMQKLGKKPYGFNLIPILRPSKNPAKWVMSRLVLQNGIVILYRFDRRHNYCMTVGDE